MDFSDTTIIIPTLNEAENIGELIDILTDLYLKVSVLVVDDGSQDATKSLVEKRGRKNKRIQFLDRSHEKVHGLTASVLDGFGKVETPYLVVMDGDLQHPPERVVKLIEALREGNQLVIGVRTKVATAWSLPRRIMSIIATALGKMILKIRGGIPCSDVMSGFFGGHAKLLKPYSYQQKGFEQEGYKILLDLLKKLPRQTKVKEVGYTFGIRQQGKSKIGAKQILAFLRSLLY